MSELSKSRGCVVDYFAVAETPYERSRLATDAFCDFLDHYNADDEDGFLGCAIGAMSFVAYETPDARWDEVSLKRIVSTAGWGMDSLSRVSAGKAAETFPAVDGRDEFSEGGALFGLSPSEPLGDAVDEYVSKSSNPLVKAYFEARTLASDELVEARSPSS